LKIKNKLIQGEHMKKLLAFALVSSVTIAGFAGCAANSPGAGSRDSGFGILSNGESNSEHFGKMHNNFFNGFIKDLNLTDTQKTQFKELKLSMQGQFKNNKGNKDELKNTLKEAFLSSSIDKAALKAKLIALQPQNDQMTAKMAENIIKAYNILTPEQRTKVENKLTEMENKMKGFMNNPIAKMFKGGPEKHFEKFTANLNLTDAQKASFKAFAQDGMPDRQAMLDKAGKIKTAVFAELKTGNPSADKIKGILDGVKTEMQSKLDDRLDKLVKVHDLLTAEQRTKLAENIMNAQKNFKGKMRGHHRKAK
jgi:Spy/CpxP family protein refolding chaperone